MVLAALTGVAGLSSVLLSAAAGGGVDIDFDKTVLAQMVLFAVLVLVLRPLLFEPVLRVFEERERRSDGARAEAREMQEKAGQLLRRFEAELDRVSAVATEERNRIRAETSKLESEILEEARNVTGKILEEGRQQIEEQVHAIRFDLGKQSEKLAREIATKVLGRELT